MIIKSHMRTIIEKAHYVLDEQAMEDMIFKMLDEKGLAPTEDGTLDIEIETLEGGKRELHIHIEMKKEEDLALVKDLPGCESCGGTMEADGNIRHHASCLKVKI